MTYARLIGGVSHTVVFRQVADVSGGRKECGEFARLFQSGVLAQQRLNTIRWVVVENGDHQRFAAVTALLVPGARCVVHQPVAKRIEVCDHECGWP